MKSIRLILTAASALLLVTLFACGGGGGGTSAPTIVTQPVSQSVTEGKTVTFMVTASGDAPLSYQWRRNGADVAGGTQSQYSFVAQLSDTSSTWSVVVRNASTAAAVSQDAKLTINRAAISALAGGSGYGYRDGPGATALFSSPIGLVFDRAGNAYVTDDHMVRRIAPDGTTVTLAGVQGVDGSVDGVGTAARFSNLSGIAIDRNGNLYVSEYPNSAYPPISPDGDSNAIVGLIRKISVQGTVTTLAKWTRGQSIDGFGLPGASYAVTPYSPVVDGAGNVYVYVASDTSCCVITLGAKNYWVILKIDPSGRLSRFNQNYVSGGLLASPGGLFMDDQDNIHATSCATFPTYLSDAYAYAILNSAGSIKFRPTLKSCVKNLALSATSTAYMVQPMGVLQTYENDGIGKLTLADEYALVAGTAYADRPVNPSFVGDLPGYFGRISSIAFSPDGTLHVVANSSILKIREP